MGGLMDIYPQTYLHSTKPTKNTFPTSRPNCPSNTAKWLKIKFMLGSYYGDFRKDSTIGFLKTFCVLQGIYWGTQNSEDSDSVAICLRLTHMLSKMPVLYSPYRCMACMAHGAYLLLYHVQYCMFLVVIAGPHALVALSALITNYNGHSESRSSPELVRI